MSAQVFARRHEGADGDADAGGPVPTSSDLSTAGCRPDKYSTHEWTAHNLATLSRAAADHHTAGHIQRASKALRERTAAQAFLQQADGTRQLGERLQDVHVLKSELERHITSLLSYTDALCTLKRRLEKATHATDIPFAIVTDNLTCRDRRVGPDRVKDRVEDELLKELDLIRNIQALLKKTLDQAINQIRLNREAQHVLELDWSDKREAYDLDDQCGRYGNTSTNTQHYSNSASAQHQTCDVNEWLKFTQQNLALAQKEEDTSAALCVLCEQILHEAAEDLQSQSDNVNEAFRQRCHQLELVKIDLQQQLNQVLDHIGAQERNIASLQQAVFDKEAPMRVAQSRLHRRSQRPNMELCRDQPQISLLSEVEQISSSVEALQQQLKDAQVSLAQLEESRMMLQKEIRCKSYSLLIDLNKCISQRTRYPSIQTLCGY